MVDKIMEVIEMIDITITIEAEIDKRKNIYKKL